MPASDRVQQSGEMSGNMRWMARVPMLMLVMVVATAATGCTKAYDARFSNPCDHDVTVATHLKPDASDEAVTRTTVPSLRSVEVQDAFFDTYGREWSIVVDEGEPVALDWERIKDEGGRVVIPAEACGAE